MDESRYNDAINEVIEHNLAEVAQAHELAEAAKGIVAAAPMLGVADDHLSLRSGMERVNEQLDVLRRRIQTLFPTPERRERVELEEVFNDISKILKGVFLTRWKILQRNVQQSNALESATKTAASILDSVRRMKNGAAYELNLALFGLQDSGFDAGDQGVDELKRQLANLQYSLELEIALRQAMPGAANSSMGCPASLPAARKHSDVTWPFLATPQPQASCLRWSRRSLHSALGRAARSRCKECSCRKIRKFAGSLTRRIGWSRVSATPRRVTRSRQWTWRANEQRRSAHRQRAARS